MPVSEEVEIHKPHEGKHYNRKTRTHENAACNYQDKVIWLIETDASGPRRKAKKQVWIQIQLDRLF